MKYRLLRLEAALHQHSGANEEPKFEMVIILKTAKKLGIAVPPTLLAIADDVIE